jgi:hypothetical protein
MSASSISPSPLREKVAEGRFPLTLTLSLREREKKCSCSFSYKEFSNERAVAGPRML